MTMCVLSTEGERSAEFLVPCHYLILWHFNYVELLAKQTGRLFWIAIQIGEILMA